MATAATFACAAGTVRASAAQQKPKAPTHAPLMPRLKAAAVTAGAAALVLSAGPTLAADLVLGEEVFNNNCAACHMGGNNNVQVEKTLRKSALEQYLDGGFNEAAIISQVENGKNAMPAWDGRLSEDEIQSVAAYVYKQASGNLW